ncbi:MAG: alpha/beta hydrolase-fold protein [Stappiaceae bacterium]
MRGLIFTCFLALFLLPSFLTELGNAGEIEGRSFYSRTLDRVYPYQIYLPTGYDSGRGRYPVLYLLHGSRNGEKAWVKSGRIQEVLDRLIAEEKLPPVLAVMPGHRGAWWIDNGRDQAETALISDLIPNIDQTYRTVGSREGRMIAGASAGGYGAVRFAIRYPDLFIAAAALSPAVYHPLPPGNSAAYREPAFLDDGVFDAVLWHDRDYRTDLPAYLEKRQPVAFYIAVGFADEFGIVDDAQALFNQLKDTHRDQLFFDLRSGNHSWRFWRETLEQGLVFMSRYIQRPASASLIPSPN